MTDCPDCRGFKTKYPHLTDEPCPVCGGSGVADVPVMWREVTRLRELLIGANAAFDECAGDYAKKLVADEAWRREVASGE